MGRGTRRILPLTYDKMVKCLHLIQQSSIIASASFETVWRRLPVWLTFQLSLSTVLFSTVSGRLLCRLAALPELPQHGPRGPPADPSGPPGTASRADTVLTGPRGPSSGRNPPFSSPLGSSSPACEEPQGSSLPRRSNSNPRSCSGVTAAAPDRRGGRRCATVAGAGGAAGGSRSPGPGWGVAVARISTNWS